MKHSPSTDSSTALLFPKEAPPRSAASTDAAHGFADIDGRPYYRIAEYDRMPAFLISLLSPSNHWFYISSRGGLTVGRIDEEHPLFPYETVDRLHYAHQETGSITLLRVGPPESAAVWSPFAEDGRQHFDLARNLYKNPAGNELLFEEFNRDLGLLFRYRWSTSDTLGFVRTARLINLNDAPVQIELLDGLRNILPPGISLGLQRSASCLADAYKQAEFDADTGLAIFSLTARISDLPEPAESLRASIAWSRGLESANVLLSDDGVLTAFRDQALARTDSVLRGRRPAFLQHATFTLDVAGERRWDIVADTHLDPLQIVERAEWLKACPDAAATIDDEIVRATDALTHLVAMADGLQHTADPVGDTHHFANVLFNCMRGGVFETGYTIPLADFRLFVKDRQRAVAERNRAFLDDLSDPLDLQALLRKAEAVGDPDLLRICYEYLPLTFSRRHGDPSRPWNRFAIHMRNPDGSRCYFYQGNWRDIFQNWEALAVSFPGYLESTVAKFVNASTVDGFNPYRLTRDGIDWEVPDPHDPWSNIGYWGDHQLIYLLKLLEASRSRHADALHGLLNTPLFTYAEIPYRIRSYPEIVANCRRTIQYDDEMGKRLLARRHEVGADGLLLSDENGQVRHVTLAEKLLVPLLAKLCNLVLDGGIWLNTQRPEWNDANNALAGPGLSMVTVGYLRRFLVFLQGLLGDAQAETFSVSAPVLDWFREVRETFEAHRGLLDQDAITDEERRRLLDALGEAFGRYREHVYAQGLGETAELPRADFLELLDLARAYVEHTLLANRRPDQLFHAYNMLHLEPGRAAVHHLDLMLEGQVSALSSGLVSPEEAVALIDAMYASDLYRPDQKSFILYPNRELPLYLDKNRVPAGEVQKIGLLNDLLAANNTRLLGLDARGEGRFNPDLGNASELSWVLDRVAEEPAYKAAVERDRQAILDLYERVFEHRTFTGRSGTMVAYEGLGSIYWHMVTKLLLAVEEVYQTAVRQEAPEAVQRALAERYYRIRGGLSSAKTPEEYGAFPFDPHSHTPPDRGAQQPGMTGQVKEEILTRFGELGVTIRTGCLCFRPTLLRRSEFAAEPGVLTAYAVDGKKVEIPTQAGEIAFTLCQVPIVYRIGELPGLVLTYSDGTRHNIRGDGLNAQTSALLLNRTGQIARIDVSIPATCLLNEIA